MRSLGGCTCIAHLQHVRLLANPGDIRTDMLHYLFLNNIPHSIRWQRMTSDKLLDDIAEKCDDELLSDSNTDSGGLSVLPVVVPTSELLVDWVHKSPTRHHTHLGGVHILPC